MSGHRKIGHGRASLHRVPCLVAGLVILAVLTFGPSLLRSQEIATAPSEEIVVNLAAGRVIIAVVKDAIIIATVENPIEPQTHPPIPVQLGAQRAGIVLGAVDWFSPSSQVQLARLDRELPGLRGQVSRNAPVSGMRTAPTPIRPEADSEATDLEIVGQGVFERLNRVAANLHAKVTLPANEPVVQVLLAGYARDYGPEVWLLSFDLVQEMRKLDYYDTRVKRPVYAQFWPPEKNQLHTLLEFQYPPENKSATILDLIKAQDPRIQKICAADPKMKDVADRFLQGDYKKILQVDATPFLRAAIAATTDANSRQTMAVIAQDSSAFEWILRPPAEPKSPLPASPQDTQKDAQPPDRPSLFGPPS